jgi:hypothetical protein
MFQIPHTIAVLFSLQLHANRKESPKSQTRHNLPNTARNPNPAQHRVA